MNGLPAASPYDGLIQQTANVYGLPADLLRAQVYRESSFDPYAFRYEDAYFERYIKDTPEARGYSFGPLAACSYGLLQILLETALEQGFTDRPERLFDPRVGLAWGAKYLRHCLALTGGASHTALARYNGTGPAALHYADAIYTLAGRTL